MKNIFETLCSNYLVDGEDGKYATYYEDEAYLLKDYDRELFEKEFQAIDGLYFPIIIFDESGTDGGRVFEADDSRGEIMRSAADYFTGDGIGLNTWTFDGYIVYEEPDLLRFESTEGDILGYVTKDEDGENVKALHEDADPIEDGWEDGIGNTISINGWGSI